MVEKMRLPDDCGTTLVRSDQERQNRAAEGPVVVSHDRPPSHPCRARCAAPRADDGEQEIDGLRRIGTTGGELRRAFRRDEAGVAMLPSVELAVEEGTAVPVIRQSWQVGVDARDEAACAIGGLPASSLGQPLCRLRRKWLHYVAGLVNYIL